MDLSWQSDQEVASRKEKVAMKGLGAQWKSFNPQGRLLDPQGRLFNVLLLLLLLAFLPLCAARQRGSSAATRHVSWI